MQLTTSRSEEKDARTIKLEIPMGKTVADLTKTFTEEICLNHLTASFKIAAQGVVRRMLKADKSDKEIVEHMKTWKPGMKKQAMSAVEKAKNAYSKLSKEERAALLKELS